jgi:hypothetical protein
MGGKEDGRQWSWSLVSCQKQSPLHRALKCVLQVARSPLPVSIVLMLNFSNRRVRTRMRGGVGGAESRGSPLSRSHDPLRKSESELTVRGDRQSKVFLIVAFLL